MVSPEVNADQRRGALVFPAGLRRAAGGDALCSDHLQPVCSLLLIQRDGVPVESQISHTAWAEEEDTVRNSHNAHRTLVNTGKCDGKLNKSINQCANLHFIFREHLMLLLGLQVSCLAVSPCSAGKQWDALFTYAQVPPFTYLWFKMQNDCFFLSDTNAGL